jgi:transposase InsO family protein
VATTLATPVPEPRMDIHKNARTTPHSRMLMMQRLTSGWTAMAVAEAHGVTLRTVRKWQTRFRDAGLAGLADRTSRPQRSPTRLSAEDEAAIIGLRRQRMTGPAIARQLGRPVSTVGVVLRRHGLGRLDALDAKPPIRRYQREHPGELIHIDTKKLGRIDGIGHRITGHHAGMVRNRGIGWDHLHVAIDDASRLAYTELLPDDRKNSAVAFLSRAVAWFGRHGVAVERIMTDNGSAYRSHDFRHAIDAAGLRHLRTRPYTPRTNGKAERFIQSSLREWAYAQPYQSSAERTAAMQPWITHYNHARPHAALGGKSPLSRLAATNPQPITTTAATSDPSPRCVGVAGVKPRKATAQGGSGLTPVNPTTAKFPIGCDNLLGNDT